MTRVTWDGSGQRRYETGVDQGVVYPLNVGNGLYDTGFAWNGLTTVTETPAGAESNPSYADNIKYLDIRSAETFGGTIEAYTYPDEFLPLDGSYVPAAGVAAGQQGRPTFGLSYRTKIGNDISPDLGFKYHLVYGLTASPSEKAFASINDSPEAIDFSWEVNSIPVALSGRAPTSLLTIDSTKVTAGALTTLTDFLYGTAGSNPSMPLPDSVLAIFTAAVTMITLSVPTFDAAHTITIPAQTGTIWYLDGVVTSPGAKILTTGQKKIVSASPAAGYAFNQPFVDRWMFTFVS